jgi:hypothetical protein
MTPWSLQWGEQTGPDPGHLYSLSGWYFCCLETLFHFIIYRLLSLLGIKVFFVDYKQFVGSSCICFKANTINQTKVDSHKLLGRLTEITMLSFNGMTTKKCYDFKKFDKKYVVESKIDVCCMLEIDLQTRDNPDSLRFPSFNVEAETNNIQSRVGVYIRNEISYKRRTDLV